MTRSVPPRAPGAREVKRELRPDETQISSRSGAGYTVGHVLHASKVDGGGGPDGHYWYVAHAFFTRANEDLGHYDDLHHAYVRPATDDECAPVISRVASRDARATCERWLMDYSSLTSVSDTGRLPPAAEVQARVVIGREVGASGAVTDGGTTFALTAESVVSHHGGYYDDYRSLTRTITRTDDVAAVITALASDDSAAIMVQADRIRQGP